MLHHPIDRFLDQSTDDARTASFCRREPPRGGASSASRRDRCVRHRTQRRSRCLGEQADHGGGIAILNSPLLWIVTSPTDTRVAARAGGLVPEGDQPAPRAAKVVAGRDEAARLLVDDRVDRRAVLRSPQVLSLQQIIIDDERQIGIDAARDLRTSRSKASSGALTRRSYGSSVK